MSNHSKRLKRIFVLLAITSLLSSNLAIFVIMRNAYERSLLSNYENICLNISSQMDNKLAQTIKLGQTICTDLALRKVVDALEKQNGYPYYADERKIINQLNSYTMMHDNLVSDIYFVSSMDTVISKAGYYQDTLKEEWYREFLEKGLPFGFSAVHYPLIGGNRSTRQKVITYIGGMYAMTGKSDPNHFMGWIMINLRCDELFQEAEDFSDILYTVTDGQGEIIQTNVRNQMKSSRFVEHYSTLQNADWTLSILVSSALVAKSLVLIGTLAGLIILLVTAGTSLLVNYFSISISIPLEQLTECMTRFSEGDFQAYAVIRSGDEVEKMSHMYNNMIDGIKQQMEQSVKQEKEKKESEIRFLMAQIKPHFIYNCLNSIIYLARKKKTEDIIEFTRAFISVLQSSIKKGPQELVPLISEIEYVQNYLTLIRYRYGYLPAFTWRIDDACREAKIPALIIQPLIENSIFHGFVEGENSGEITIKVSREEGKVKVEVRDNGRGMSAQALEHLRKEISQSSMLPEWSEHIGLFNVNERLILCYGRESGLNVESTAGKGTRVWFYGETV